MVAGFKAGLMPSALEFTPLEFETLLYLTYYEFGKDQNLLRWSLKLAGEISLEAALGYQNLLRWSLKQMVPFAAV